MGYTTRETEHPEQQSKQEDKSSNTSTECRSIQTGGLGRSTSGVDTEIDNLNIKQIV